MMIFNLERDQAALQAHLHHDGVIAYPTEAVFGLGCLPDSESALAQIYALKQRSADKPCLLVAAEVQQIAAWIDVPYPPIPAHATTFVLPASAHAPAHLVYHGKIAIRITTYPPLKRLCAFSPLVSTSANPSGQPPATTVAQVHAYFPNLWIVEGEVGGNRQPSQMIDVCTGAQLR